MNSFWTTNEKRDQIEKAGKLLLSRSCGDTSGLHAPSKIRGAGECPCVWPLPPQQGSRGSIVCFVICAGLHADSQTHRPEHISAQNKAGSTECHNTNLASLSGAAPALQAISTCLAPTGLSKQPHTHSLHTSLLHKVALSRLEEIAILSNSYKQI